MACKIYVPASEVCGFFLKNKKRLEAGAELIAENCEYGVEVFLAEALGLPKIEVYADDDLVYEEAVIDRECCAETVEDIYDTYLTDNVVKILSGENEISQDDEIDQRETELDMLVTDFITGVMSTGGYFDSGAADADEIVDDCKEHFLEYLARKHGLRVYRPMYLEDEDGNEFFDEYPYECMEFDDEDVTD